MGEPSNPYLIKDIARLSGHSVYTIKDYLKRGLIREAGRSPVTRFRFFNDATLNRLLQIRAFRKQGHSLAQIQQRLGAGVSEGQGR
jgi:DNA-binding transcriptional MerR regulator